MLPKVGQVGLLFSNDLVFLYTFISGWPLHSSALVCFYERKATNRILPLLSYRVVTSYIFRAVLILISNLLPLLKTHLPLLPLLCRNLKFPELYIFCHIQKFTAKKKNFFPHCVGGNFHYCFSEMLHVHYWGLLSVSKLSLIPRGFKIRDSAILGKGFIIPTLPYSHTSKLGFPN